MAQAANTADFFGEGTAAPAAAPALTQEELDRQLLARNIAANRAAATNTANINMNRQPTNAAAPPGAAQTAFNNGNIGGASGAFNAVSPAGQAAFTAAHNTPGGGNVSGLGSFIRNPFGSAGALGAAQTIPKPIVQGIGLVGEGVKAGLISGAQGDSAVPNQIGAGIAGVDPNGIAGAVDNFVNGPGVAPVQVTPDAQRPNAALDAAVGGPGGFGGGGGAPINTGNPGAIAGAAAARMPTFGSAPSIGTVAGSLNNFRPAPAAPPTGAMASAPGQVSMGALPGREAIQPLPGTGRMGALPGTVGQGALPGTVSMGTLPGQTDRSLQTAALDRVLGFDANTASKAEAQLADAQQMNLSNSLALARSARGGPAAQAQALRAAQGEGAATMSQTSRDLATLRAQEEDTAKSRELQALGLGGQLSGDIRTGDIGERGQNVGALEASLAAGTAQRGQTIGAVTADQASLASQRGQTIDALLGERNAGVAERGQTVGAQTAALNAGVSQRGQDVGALEAALTAGVTQRGQTVEQQIAERTAGVAERGQTTTAGTAANQQKLDAILGTGQLAQTERNAGVTERGQNINAMTSQEQIAAQRDIANNSNLTEQQKIAANTAIQKAALGYQLTPAEQIALENARIKAGQPSGLQKLAAGAQAVGSVTPLL